MLDRVVTTCLRVLQNVKTRFSARWVFSRVWRDGGHGMELVMGTEREESLRASGGDSLALEVRCGLVPPSWAFVGIIAVVVEGLAGSGVSTGD